ncbi:MAG: transaldolase [Blastocatellales bacterium]
MNHLLELQRQGQAIWMDYVRRGLITSGELKRLVEEDGLRGVTSNPTIFEKAIAETGDYDETLHKLLDARAGSYDRALFEELAVEDIQMAADVLRGVYDKLDGADGFVSLEVAPDLAGDTASTIAEARRLWKEVSRPNVMIKVPATAEGIPAIESLLAEGININITLMFSMSHYEAVARAYLRGMERASNPRGVASVASFFVSRVDTAVDRALEAIGAPEALALRGKIAIANAKIVYQRFREIFHGDAFAALRKRGARVQRPLWASTSAKNPAYSDVMYVEELIGPETINTMPPATLNAFRDHGRARATLQEGVKEAETALARLKQQGVDLNAITEQLQVDGVAAFTASFYQLLAAIEKKCKVIRATESGRNHEQTRRHGQR